MRIRKLIAFPSGVDFNDPDHSLAIDYSEVYLTDSVIENGLSDMLILDECKKLRDKVVEEAKVRDFCILEFWKDKLEEQ